MTTALNLHFDEWPFVDSSGLNKPVTNSGVVAASASGVFDGASHLEINSANSLMPVNSEEWEIDFLVTHSSPSGTYYALYESDAYFCSLSHHTSGNSGIGFTYKYAGVTVLSLTGDEITDSEEHHIALTKDGSTFRLYLDGVLQDSAEYNFGNEIIDSDIFIGQNGNDDDYLFASMRNLRISTVARWKTSAFGVYKGYSPTTDENTQLLIPFAEVADESESGLPIWNPTQVTRGNLDTGLRIYKFGKQCGYFPGEQGDFAPYSLEIPDHANWYIGDSDFVLDTWLYPLSVFNYAGLITQFEAGVGRWQWYINAAGELKFYVESNGGASTLTLTSSGTVPTSEWSHIAMTRKIEITDIPGITFDPDNTHADLTLSNNNLTLTKNTGSANRLSYITEGKSSGKWYCELTIDNLAAANGVTFGIVEAGDTLAGYPGDDANSWGIHSLDGDVWNNGGDNSYGNSFTTNDVIMLAIDLDNGELYWGENGTWYNSGNPVTRTNPGATGVTGTKYVAVSEYNTNDAVTLNLGDTPFSYSIPTGYEKMNTGEPIPVQVWRMYIKGILQAQHTEDFTIPDLSAPLWIGRGTSTSDLYYGYMDELRLLVGQPVWTEKTFWPYDYPYFDEALVYKYKRLLRRRIASIQGRNQ